MLSKQKSSIAEYKRCAFLKYCNENDNKKHQLDKLSTSNDLLKLGIFYWFVILILIFILNYMKVFSVFVIARFR